MRHSIVFAILSAMKPTETGAVAEYVAEVTRLAKTGKTTEHSFRGALAVLIDALAPGLKAVCLSVRALAMCCVVCLGALLYRCLESSTLRKLPVSAACALTLAAFALGMDHQQAQARLEQILCYGCEQPDAFPAGEPPDVPLRNRDALPEFRRFIAGSGWTTNQFIEGLMLAFTNCTTVTNWSQNEQENISGNAGWKLSEIDHPSVTNFFRKCNDEEMLECRGVAIPGMIPYTKLEPEVLAYMRTLCVRTNLYDDVATMVMYNMFDTLSTMPDTMKPAATNRVAQYLYFSLYHTTQDLSYQDRMLAEFLPAYSNSVQRLDALAHIAATTTNSVTRANVQQRIDLLSAIPTTQLNDISWIAEE